MNVFIKKKQYSSIISEPINTSIISELNCSFCKNLLVYLTTLDCDHFMCIQCFIHQFIEFIKTKYKSTEETLIVSTEFDEDGNEISETTEIMTIVEGEDDDEESEEDKLIRHFESIPALVQKLPKQIDEIFELLSSSQEPDIQDSIEEIKGLGSTIVIHELCLCGKCRQVSSSIYFARQLQFLLQLNMNLITSDQREDLYEQKQKTF
ncbi:hypothetical protein RCL1_008954 [Eukaryota sp. TZLM3-RCL]